MKNLEIFRELFSGRQLILELLKRFFSFKASKI